MSDLLKTAERLLHAWDEDEKVDPWIEQLRDHLKKSKPQLCVLLTPKDSSEDCFNRR